MIAPAVLPPEYLQWNRKHHAPYGRTLPFRVPPAWPTVEFFLRGPFSVQPNSETRHFEYPWAWEQISRLPVGSRLVEVGGGLSGLQFVLARKGYDVTNVDPGMAAKGLGFPADAEQHRRLARMFRGPARLIPTVIEDAGIPPQSVDGVVCVSTLEHLTPEDIDGVATSISTVLRPSGLLVLTVDLFLDVYPFAADVRNKWGTNINIRSFLDRAELTLVSGKRSELFGFPEFDHTNILARRRDFLIGAGGIALAQCLVASR